MLGVTGDKDAFTVLDVYSGLRAMYATPDKTAEETAKAIRLFAGDRRIMRFYSDKSGEIGAALKTMGILAEDAEPGEPRTNTLAETNNRIILDGIRVTLSCAGLPACYWVWAGPHFCLMQNLRAKPDGSTTPWFLTHGTEFRGPLIPFGACVTYWLG